MKYFIILMAMFIMYACQADIPETGRTVTEKEPNDIIINVNNINQNYLLTDENDVPRDNITVGDNITISIVNSPTNNNTNTACNIDNSSDNSSDNGSCVAFQLRVLKG